MIFITSSEERLFLHLSISIALYGYTSGLMTDINMILCRHLLSFYKDLAVLHYKH